MRTRTADDKMRMARGDLFQRGAEMSDTFTKLPNYNPASQGLHGPLQAVGNCQRDERLDVDRFTWCDFYAPIYSGDMVTVFFCDEDYASVLGKRIERTRDGRIWLTSWLSDSEDSFSAMPLDYRPMADCIVAIAPVVCILDKPRSTRRVPLPDDLPPAKVQHKLAELAAPALSEWARLGYPPRERLEIENDSLVVRRLIATPVRANA